MRLQGKLFGPLTRSRTKTNFWQLPLNVNDDDLESNQQSPRQTVDSITNMSSAIHLFKLARFNSEIKFVLYCVDRIYLPHTQPAITDVAKWQRDMLHRLRQWREEIPRHPEGSARYYMNLLCEIKYHELIMLLLRPSPLFQRPAKASVRECFSSAMRCSELYHKLYTTSTLHYSWISAQSLFLCVITMFYCVWRPDGVADEVNIDTLMRALKSTSDVLSATGEYWPEANRSRDVLDRISSTTMRRFTQGFNETQGNRVPSRSQPAAGISSNLGWEQPADVSDVEVVSDNLPPLHFENGDLGNDPFSPFYRAQADSFTTTNMLSYFMGSGTDMNTESADVLGEYYPGVDEVMHNFFEGGFRDLELVQ